MSQGLSSPIICLADEFKLSMNEDVSKSLLFLNAKSPEWNESLVLSLESRALASLVFSLLATDKFSIRFITDTLKPFQPIDPAGQMDEEVKNWAAHGSFNTALHIDTQRT